MIDTQPGRNTGLGSAFFYFHKNPDKIYHIHLMGHVPTCTMEGVTMSISSLVIGQVPKAKRLDDLRPALALMKKGGIRLALIGMEHLVGYASAGSIAVACSIAGEEGISPVFDLRLTHSPEAVASIMAEMIDHLPEAGVTFSPYTTGAAMSALFATLNNPEFRGTVWGVLPMNADEAGILNKSHAFGTKVSAREMTAPFEVESKIAGEKGSLLTGLIVAPTALPDLPGSPVGKNIQIACPATHQGTFAYWGCEGVKPEDAIRDGAHMVILDMAEFAQEAALAACLAAIKAAHKAKVGTSH